METHIMKTFKVGDKIRLRKDTWLYREMLNESESDLDQIVEYYGNLLYNQDCTELLTDEYWEIVTPRFKRNIVKVGLP